jgi:DNA polymerase-3 subunit beta
VFSRLLDGEFHNYKSSIPSDFSTEVIIKTRELAEALDRCSLLISEKNKSPIKCIFSDGQLSISCQTAIGKINDELGADINGNTVTIGFNNRFAIEALRAADTDSVRLQMNGGNRPIKILPMMGDSFVYLLMPVTLRN